jgi:hypothetical protein
VGTRGHTLRRARMQHTHEHAHAHACTHARTHARTNRQRERVCVCVRERERERTHTHTHTHTNTQYKHQGTFEALASKTYGANLMGAGSGGFILAVLKAGVSRQVALEAACNAVRDAYIERERARARKRESERERGGEFLTGRGP